MLRIDKVIAVHQNGLELDYFYACGLYYCLESSISALHIFKHRRKQKRNAAYSDMHALVYAVIAVRCKDGISKGTCP